MLGALESRGPMSAEMVPLNIEMHKGKEEKQRQAHQNLASHDVRTMKVRESATSHRCRLQCGHREPCRQQHRPSEGPPTCRIDSEPHFPEQDTHWRIRTEAPKGQRKTLLMIQGPLAQMKRK